MLVLPFDPNYLPNLVLAIILTLESLNLEPLNLEPLCLRPLNLGLAPFPHRPSNLEFFLDIPLQNPPRIVVPLNCSTLDHFHIFPLGFIHHL